MPEANQIEMPGNITDAGLEGQTPPIVPPKDQPKFGGGEFSSVEELEAAYAKLKESASQTTPPSDQSTANSEEISREQAVEQLNGKHLDISSFESEWMQTGEISEDSYAKLEKAGIPRNLVDKYISAQSTVAEQYITDIKGVAGGEEGYDQMVEWAKSNLNPNEIASFNNMVNSADLGAVRLAVEGLAARWHGAEGHAPNLVRGKASSAGSPAQGFRSPQEMVEAMRDPRYGKDPAYTHDVEKRVGAARW